MLLVKQVGACWLWSQPTWDQNLAPTLLIYVTWGTYDPAACDFSHVLNGITEDINDRFLQRLNE